MGYTAVSVAAPDSARARCCYCCVLICPPRLRSQCAARMAGGQCALALGIGAGADTCTAFPGSGFVPAPTILMAAVAVLLALELCQQTSRAVSSASLPPG